MAKHVDIALLVVLLGERATPNAVRQALVDGYHIGHKQAGRVMADAKASGLVQAREDGTLYVPMERRRA